MARKGEIGGQGLSEGLGVSAWILILLLIGGSVLVPENAMTQPDIENYATIEAYVGSSQVPVYAFGYTYVYGMGPDLLPGAVMQEGNTQPIEKFKPKKSWEITSNYCGSTPAREPKTMWNDDQPLLPIHLIDGDPETAWSSRGMLAPGVQPEWIRIDLPQEATISSVNLVCCKVGPSANATLRLGKSLPKHLIIKISTDGKQWDTVYENSSFTGTDAGPNPVSFGPRRAKMVWVIGQVIEGLVGFWGPSFSIGELEVLDTEGHNLALVSRGAGVQVSSTHFGYGMDRFTQDMLWPIQYDLGFKWSRVGYDMGTYLWSYVEREKGKLEIDRRSDEVITEAHNNGVNMILCLDKGNWLYKTPPRKTDWKVSRVKEIMETYYDHQGWPHESDAMMEGYLRYVDYMVRHFKGRVAYFEICNEWQGIGIENYFKILSSAIKTIKNADPEARIMLGSTGGFDRESILRCLGAQAASGVKDGKMRLSGGNAIATVKDIVGKDLLLSVDAGNNAEAGLILRYKDHNNFLLAHYSPINGGVYFHEVVNGNWGGMLDRIQAETLQGTVHLEAKLQDKVATLTVTAGDKVFTTSHQCQSVPDEGRVGLFQNVSPRQDFDNFRASDLNGKILFEDAFDDAAASAEKWKTSGNNFVAPEKIGPALNAVGWHPFYQMDPDSPSLRSYREDVAQFKKDCEELGFKGTYIASEWTWAAPYPGAPDWCTEMKKAKYCAQAMTMHSSMDVISLYNETFQTGRINWDCNLVRNTSFQVDPITPAQPQPVYYVLRNVSTILDGFKGTSFEVRLSGDKKFDCDKFVDGKGVKMFAAWIPGKTEDGIVQSKSDITLPGMVLKKAAAFDPMNGTKQDLVFSHDGNDTILKGMLVKDYPVYIQFE